jgi:hypothetical protein
VKEIKTTGRRSPSEDFEFEAWLFPLGRRTLMIAHTEQDGFTEWLDGLPFVHRYEYYDNTDRPEDVDARSWGRRRRDWERVLAWGASASDTSLTMTMFNHEFFMVPTAGEAIVHVPSADRRIARIAVHRHIDEVHRDIVARRQAVDAGWKPQGFETYFEAEAIARGDEPARERIREALRPVIRDLTQDDLEPPRSDR